MMHVLTFRVPPPAAHPLLFRCRKPRDEQRGAKSHLTLENRSKENLQRKLLQELYRPAQGPIQVERLPEGGS